jgi:hypothetical protein
MPLCFLLMLITRFLKGMGHSQSLTVDRIAIVIPWQLRELPPDVLSRNCQ